MLPCVTLFNQRADHAHEDCEYVDLFLYEFDARHCLPC